MYFNFAENLIHYYKHTAFSLGCYGRLPHEKNIARNKIEITTR